MVASNNRNRSVCVCAPVFMLGTRCFCFCRYTGMPSALRIFTSGVRDLKNRRRMKKMSWNRENWERQKEEKMKKDKEIEDILWINWVLSARSSRPESWRCRATLPGRYDLEVGSTVLLSWERKRSVYSLCLLSTSGIDVLFFQYFFSNRTLHQWQQGDVVS